jgi:hypothetical protein
MAKDSIGATWILNGMKLPSYKTIDRVINDLLDNIELIFKQIIDLCDSYNLIGKKRAFIDGTKTKANASKHKAMSYEYLCKKIDNNKNTIQDLMEEVIENIDGLEDLDDEELKEMIFSEAEEIYETAEKIHQKKLNANQKAIFGGKKEKDTTKIYPFPSVPDGQTTIFDHVDSDDKEEVKEKMIDIGIKNSRQQNMEAAKDELEKRWREENGNKSIPDKEQINFTDPDLS